MQESCELYQHIDLIMIFYLFWKEWMQRVKYADVGDVPSTSS